MDKQDCICSDQKSSPECKANVHRGSQGTALAEITSSEWMDALERNMERRIAFLERGGWSTNLHMAGEIKYWLNYIRSERTRESASIDSNSATSGGTQ